MLAHSKEKNIVRVKTRGQSIILQRVSMPMQTSDKASSPTKRRRAKQILAFRSIISGRKTEAIEAQEEKNIRSISTEKARKIIGISEKWKSRETIPKSYALAMKSKLGLSWDKFRALTRLLRPHNVRLENENAQRKYQSDILPQDLVVENHNFLLKNDKKEDYFHSAPAMFIDNFQNYLFHILDQYDNQTSCLGMEATSQKMKYGLRKGGSWTRIT